MDERELLRAQIQLGVTALERSEAIEIDEGELEHYFAELTTPCARRSRCERAR